MVSADPLPQILKELRGRHPGAEVSIMSGTSQALVRKILAGEKLILGERGGNTRRLIDGLFEEAGVQPVVAMELSRQAAIKNMVAADMGVGIVPLSTARDDVEQGRLVRWWIEGARINWELGVARLHGGYVSPVTQTFLELCREHFSAGTDGAEPKRAAASKPASRGVKAGRKAAKKGSKKSKK